MVKVLRSWRIPGEARGAWGAYLVVEETLEPNKVAIVLSLGDNRRIWLSKEAFAELTDLRYAIRYEPGDAVPASETEVQS